MAYLFDTYFELVVVDCDLLLLVLGLLDLHFVLVDCCSLVVRLCFLDCLVLVDCEYVLYWLGCFN